MDGIDADGQMLDEDDKILHQILEGGHQKHLLMLSMRPTMNVWNKIFHWG